MRLHAWYVDRVVLLSLGGVHQVLDAVRESRDSFGKPIYKCCRASYIRKGGTEKCLDPSSLYPLPGTYQRATRVNSSRAGIPELPADIWPWTVAWMNYSFSFFVLRHRAWRKYTLRNSCTMFPFPGSNSFPEVLADWHWNSEREREVRTRKNVSSSRQLIIF